MKTIAFLNNKGGVGKSASVKTLAHIISSVYDKKVLIVDLDPQGNTSSLYTQVDWVELFKSILEGTTRKAEYSVEDILLNQELDPHVSIHHTKYKNLDIIPAFLTLSEIEERMKADVKTPQQFRMKIQLEKLQDEYDYCLIDCSPSISLLNINGLAASDEVYIPTKVDGDSLIGVAITVNLIRTVASYNPKLKIGGCFFTLWQNKNVSSTAYELLETVLPKNMLLPMKIGVSKYVEEST